MFEREREREREKGKRSREALEVMKSPFEEIMFDIKVRVRKQSNKDNTIVDIVNVRFLRGESRLFLPRQLDYWTILPFKAAHLHIFFTHAYFHIVMYVRSHFFYF